MFCIISAGYFNTTDIYEHVILYENLSEDPEMELTRIFKVRYGHTNEASSCGPGGTEE